MRIVSRIGTVTLLLTLPHVALIAEATGAGDACTEGIVLDDGTYESAYRTAFAHDTRFVQLFTPASYPVALERICICWRSTGTTALNYEVVVYDDNGESGAPGTLLGSKIVSATGMTEAGNGNYFGYDCSDLGVSVASGGVFIGPKWDAASNVQVFACADQSPTTQLATGYRYNGSNWEYLPLAFFDFRALGVRAVFDAQGGGGCTPSSTVLCLNNGRFKVEVTWHDFQGGSGPGNTIPFSGDSGFFWFFDSTNVEMLVKVLNGCSLGGNYWVFAAATTNVAYELHVTDTDTGLVKTYTNQAGVSAPAITDTSAFATCP